MYSGECEMAEAQKGRFFSRDLEVECTQAKKQGYQYVGERNNTKWGTKVYLLY